jgi:hypothetical protein
MSFLNSIDLLVIVTYILLLVVDRLSFELDLIAIHYAYLVLQSLRLLRILKLAKHLVGLQSIGYSLKRSYKEFGLMLLIIVVGVLVFATLVYYVERDQIDTSFITIPHAFWWAIVTMTTVGYGDMIPVTTLGRVVGAMCSISGVLVIALPIPIFVRNFTESHKDQKRRQKVLDDRKVTEWTGHAASRGLVILRPNVSSSFTQ